MSLIAQLVLHYRSIVVLPQLLDQWLSVVIAGAEGVNVGTGVWTSLTVVNSISKSIEHHDFHS